MIMLLAKYIRIPLSVFLLSVKSGEIGRAHV